MIFTREVKYIADASLPSLIKWLSLRRACVSHLFIVNIVGMCVSGKDSRNISFATRLKLSCSISHFIFHQCSGSK